MSEMITCIFHAFWSEITNFTIVTKPLTSVALFWVISIPKVLNNYANIAKFMDFVIPVKIFTW